MIDQNAYNLTHLLTKKMIFRFDVPVTRSMIDWCSDPDCFWRKCENCSNISRKQTNPIFHTPQEHINWMFGRCLNRDCYSGRSTNRKVTTCKTCSKRYCQCRASDCIPSHAWREVCRGCWVKNHRDATHRRDNAFRCEECSALRPAYNVVYDSQVDLEVHRAIFHSEGGYEIVIERGKLMVRKRSDEN